MLQDLMTKSAQVLIGILNAAEAGMLLFTTKTKVSLSVKDSSLEMKLL